MRDRWISKSPFKSSGPEDEAADRRDPSEVVAAAIPTGAMAGAEAYYHGAHFVSATQLDDYVAQGTKWGPSGAFGTSGGTVSWSMVGSGWSNGSPEPAFFSGTTVALSNFLSFDFTAILTQAFAAWSAVANINFVQVADGGGNMGAGANAMIRIGGAFMDGAPTSGQP